MRWRRRDGGGEGEEQEHPAVAAVDQVGEAGEVDMLGGDVDGMRLWGGGEEGGEEPAVGGVEFLEEEEEEEKAAGEGIPGIVCLRGVG